MSESPPEERGRDDRIAVEVAIAWTETWLSAELERVIQVCFHCGRVRSGEGQWREIPPPVLDALCERPDLALLTHGICPDCFTVYYPAEEGAQEDE